MRRFLKRSILALVPAMLSALVLWVPTGTSDLGLQSTALACNDGTQLNLALDPTALTALSDAVAAIALYPAGNPALACSLSSTAPGSGSAQYDYAVGAGYGVNPTTGAQRAQRSEWCVRHLQLNVGNPRAKLRRPCHLPVRAGEPSGRRRGRA